MPATSPEAKARARARVREWGRRKNAELRANKPLPAAVLATDGKWFVLECEGCYCHFDVPAIRRPGRLPRLCSECKAEGR